MTVAMTYIDRLCEILREAVASQSLIVERAAELVADSIDAGGLVRVFGSGHSQLVANEVTFRAGGLGAVQAIFDAGTAPTQPEQAGLVERVEGYGETIVATCDIHAGGVCFVVSNSGINPVPIEVAAGLRRRGVTVVAITNLAHSNTADTRDRHGRRLYDEADLVIDTHAGVGDALAGLPSGKQVGPASTVVAAAMLHAVISRAAELLEDRGSTAPVVVTQNLDTDEVTQG